MIKDFNDFGIIKEMLKNDFSESKDWKHSDVVGKVDWLMEMHISHREEIERLENAIEECQMEIEELREYTNVALPTC